jgi:hypothetical protein
MPFFEVTIIVLGIPTKQSSLEWKDTKFKFLENSTLLFALGEKVLLDYSAEKPDSSDSSDLQTKVSYDKSNLEYSTMMTYLTND